MLAKLFAGDPEQLTIGVAHTPERGKTARLPLDGRYDVSPGVRVAHTIPALALIDALMARDAAGAPGSASTEYAVEGPTEYRLAGTQSQDKAGP